MFWISYYTSHIYRVIPFLGGWFADRLLGDPEGWLHPVVGFGKLISAGEDRLNTGENRRQKGAVFALFLILFIYAVTQALLYIANFIHPQFYSLLVGIGVFYCLSGTTLIQEVRAVFVALEKSTDAGRKQLSRIVGRDTSRLSPQEIRIAALETLAENLSDGVIAPMFWYMLLGLPGMMAYKMVNTLDSMIGYKNERYLEFGAIAAKLDDLANYIPARLTAYLMLFVSGNWDKRGFVNHFGRAHTSPNAGYPEAALAAILDCRFGGSHTYFGESVEKPYIGTNDRLMTPEDMELAIRVNNNTELVMGFLVTLFLFQIPLWQI
ncbi:adenosylcobinamide-phosphate synthase CbiB [Parabacteroides sp. OttesenSCG-928-G07]|nr:adenosylcobinamide-phosphate synthase CbiB [Parabacteroides sp. OttesenSCG-928-G07]